MIDGVWDNSALAEFVDDTIGGLWGSSPNSAKPDETDVLVVRGADFRNWNTRRALDAAPRRVPTRFLERRRLAPGDLVLEVSGGSLAQPVGRVLVIDELAVAKSSRPLICSNFCRKLRLKPGVDAHFVKRQLDWLYRSGHTDQFQTSTTNIRNLQVDDFLRGTSIVRPDQSLQVQLTAILDRLDASRDGGSTHLAAARRAIERFRQAVLAAACSGSLTSEWREDHGDIEPASELVRRTKLAAEKAGQQLGRIAARKPDYLDIPETWEWAPLGWLAAIKGGIQKQPKRAPKNNAYPYLRVANVLRGRLDLHEVHQIELFGGELVTYSLEPNDLLVVEGNGSVTEIGRSAIWKGDIKNCVHQNHIIRVRCLEVDPYYIDLFWNSPIGSHEIAELAVTSSGLYNLSVGKVSSFPVPIAPIEEQREIVRRTFHMLELANELLNRIDLASRAVDRSSQAILSKAFRGALLPTGADLSPVSKEA